MPRQQHETSNVCTDVGCAVLTGRHPNTLWCFNDAAYMASKVEFDRQSFQRAQTLSTWARRVKTGDGFQAMAKSNIHTVGSLRLGVDDDDDNCDDRKVETKRA